LSPFAFLSAPWPRYWTGFDVGTNFLGYVPLGFLLALAALRSGRATHAVSLAALAAGLLSLCMETLQAYLPARVPSLVDFVLNASGAWAGAISAGLLEKMGALQRWSDFRARWFSADARGALVLLALWPLALLFPPSVPLGLGQVLERLEMALAAALDDSPFLEWLPVRDIELQPMVPGAEVIAVALGGLIPCLIGYGVIRGWVHRSIFLCWLLPGGMLFTALSAALSYGPVHAWAWFDAPVRAGFLGAGLLALLTLWVPPRAAAALALLASDAAGTLHASPEHKVQAVLRLAVHGRPDAPACYADYLRLVQAGPGASGADPQAAHSAWATAVLRAFDRFRLVCAVHEGDWGTRSLNLAVQLALTEAGLLKARGEWFVGRPAMVTRNDSALGVFNGDVGITLPALDPGAALRVYFLDGDTLRSVASSRLPHVETAFAMTVHKCQGSEFLHTALVLPGADARVLTRELVYTGITRARERFTLLQAQPGALAAAIARPSQRASGLALQLALAGSGDSPVTARP
jgi:hypothetical protein